MVGKNFLLEKALLKNIEKFGIIIICLSFLVSYLNLVISYYL